MADGVKTVADIRAFWSKRSSELRLSVHVERGLLHAELFDGYCVVVAGSGRGATLAAHKALVAWLVDRGHMKAADRDAGLNELRAMTNEEIIKGLLGYRRSRSSRAARVQSEG